MVGRRQKFGTQLDLTVQLSCALVYPAGRLKMQASPIRRRNAEHRAPVI
jgi:hypothetical protein